MTYFVIKIDHDAYSELKDAVLTGAFASHKAYLQALMARSDDNSSWAEKKMTHLSIAAHNVVNAWPEEEYNKRNMPWNIMSNDDWIHGAQHMEREAEKELARGPGDYQRNASLAERHIAKAYYHADTSNQKKMRNLYGFLFYYHYMMYEREKREGEQP